MQISTTARRCELDPELRQFAQERLQKVTRFARDIQEAHLIVTAEKFRHTAEITLKVDHREMVVREESPELKLAIVLAIDGLEEQLRRLKERRVASKRVARPNGVPEETPAAESDDEGFEE